MTIDLRYGDTIEQMKLIPDKSIDAIICDLPYGTTACKWDTIIPFDKLWAEYKRIISDNGAIVLFGSQPFTSELIHSNIKQYKTSWIWDKQRSTNFVQAKNHPLKRTEDILVFGKNKINYYPQMIKRTEEETKLCNSKKRKINRVDVRADTFMNISGGKWETKTNFEHKYPINIISISAISNECNSKHRLHPTQKPISLMEYLILTYSTENDTILDNTFGSCTTGIACINTNRNFIGIENNMDYFNISLKRVEEKRKEKDFILVTSFGDELCEYMPDRPTKATVYGWVHANKVPVHKGGKKLRFLKSEIDNWMKS
jgi:site-specific DNA-methyltransferase (adenine-specific)